MKNHTKYHGVIAGLYASYDKDCRVSIEGTKAWL